MNGYTAFKSSTASAARVSKPRAPPAPKYRTPWRIRLSISASSRSRNGATTSGGIRRWPVKQQVVIEYLPYIMCLLLDYTI